MLSRRACMLSDRDRAAKAFSKAVAKAGLGGSGASAQQQRVEDLRRAKEEKENELERCSKTGKAEIRRFHQRRLTEMRDALAHYAEGQIGCARDACEDLAKGLARLRELNLTQQQQQQQEEDACEDLAKLNLTQQQQQQQDGVSEGQGASEHSRLPDLPKADREEAPSV